MKSKDMQKTTQPKLIIHKDILKKAVKSEELPKVGAQFLTLHNKSLETTWKARKHCIFIS